MGLPVAVDITEIRFAIEPIVTLGGKDQPAGVARPGMVGVAPWTIDHLHRIDASCFQVHHLQVRLLMPDREGTVVCNGIDQVSAVGGDTGVADTSFIKYGVYLVTDCSCLLIKRNTHQGILQLLQFHGQFHVLGSAIVNVFAIR